MISKLALVTIFNNNFKFCNNLFTIDVAFNIVKPWLKSKEFKKLFQEIVINNSCLVNNYDNECNTSKILMIDSILIKTDYLILFSCLKKKQFKMFDFFIENSQLFMNKSSNGIDFDKLHSIKDENDNNLFLYFCQMRGKILKMMLRLLNYYQFKNILFETNNNNENFKDKLKQSKQYQCLQYFQQIIDNNK